MVLPSAFTLSSRPKLPWKVALQHIADTQLPPLHGPVPAEGEDEEDDDWEGAGPYRPGHVSKMGVSEWSPRDALVYVPKSYSPHRPCPVVLALHGEQSSADEVMNQLLPLAEQHRLLVAAPDPRGDAWAWGSGFFNEDVYFIDKALDSIFENYAVRDDKVGLAGFAGGASFALDLGIRNGPVFSHVMAFCPTEMEPPCYEDGPDIFISLHAHPGTHDLRSKTASGTDGTPGTSGTLGNPSTPGAQQVCRPCHNVAHRILPRLRSCGQRCWVHEFQGGTPERHSPHAGVVSVFSTCQSGDEGVTKSPSVSRSAPSTAGVVGTECGSHPGFHIPQDVVVSAVEWFMRSPGQWCPEVPSFELLDLQTRKKGCHRPLERGRSSHL